MVLKRYILSNLSMSFLPIFFALFTIASIVYSVKLASLTSVIKVNFGEFLYMYFLYIPQILYYVLPITIFLATVVTLNKLSSEYELVVLNSFGLKPMKIISIFFPILFLFSLILFIISFIIVPKMDTIFDNFKKIKQTQAEFNIKAGAFGQKFGKWLIFVDKKDKKIYENITLFQRAKDKDIFITAKKAKIENDNSYISMELFNGSSLTISKNNIKQVDFKKMVLNNRLKTIRKLENLKDLYEFWMQGVTQKTSTMVSFSKNIFYSLLPIASIFLYLAFGYYNPRFEKNNNVTITFFLLIIYLTVVQKIMYVRDLKILLFVVFWVIFSYILYLVKVKRFY